MDGHHSAATPFNVVLNVHDNVYIDWFNQPLILLFLIQRRDGTNTRANLTDFYGEHALGGARTSHAPTSGAPQIHEALLLDFVYILVDIFSQCWLLVHVDLRLCLSTVRNTLRGVRCTGVGSVLHTAASTDGVCSTCHSVGVAPARLEGATVHGGVLRVVVGLPLSMTTRRFCSGTCAGALVRLRREEGCQRPLRQCRCAHHLQGVQLR